MLRLLIPSTKLFGGKRSMSMFQLRTDSLTGLSEWVVIHDDAAESSTADPLAATSYLDMLNDGPRNRAYHNAITNALTIKPSSHVLDIGGGTGLLAMMAAKAVGQSGSVSCCESYLPMFKLLRRVLRSNGFQSRVAVLNKRSDELSVGSDLASRADVVVSEILDSELLGEGLIPTLQHAHDSLLVSNPLSVPYRAVTYAQLVESPFLSSLCDLRANELRASDGISLANDLLGVKSKQYAFQCDAMEKEIKLLSEPFRVFEFDFGKRPDSHGEAWISVKAIGDGRVHALISWWVLQLDREGTIFYSTAPKWIESPTHKRGDKEWCDHWKQCVWFVPSPSAVVSKDEEVKVHALHDEISVSYRLEPRKQSEEDFLIALSPERAGVYGDSEWRNLVLKAVSGLLEGQKNDSLCLVLDDSVFLTLALARLSTTSNIAAHFPGLREKGLRYLQAVSDANKLSMERVRVLESSNMLLTFNALYSEKIDLLLGEPFYYGAEGKLPWQNLRFWRDRTTLSSALSEDAVVMPCKGILKGCAMSLPDLWKSRRCLDRVEGFDHSAVNETLGACGNLPAPKQGPCLPYFVWQCGEYKKLSDEFTIMEFDFSKPMSACRGTSQIEFVDAGVCHGVVLWIDWVLDPKNSVIISTGPDKRFWKQGVKLLSNPVQVGISTRASLGAVFDPSKGSDLVVTHDFS